MQPQLAQSRVEAEVRRIRALVEKRQFAASAEAAAALLAEVPENRDVLYLVAVSQRYLGQLPDALATLERFERLHPDFGRLYQERGHCYRTLGKGAAAMEAYRRAVALNPALIASWRTLAALYRSAGQPANAQAAQREVAQLGGLPPPVLSAAGLLTEGDVLGAERILRAFLQRHPDHVEAMRLLAQVGSRLDVLDDAEFLLESVLVFAPDYHIARYDYACVLSKRHKHERALEEARKLLQVEPSNRAFRTVYATACVGLGDHDEALRAFRELVSETPDNAELHLSIAHALKTLGRQAEAIAAYRQSAAVRPSFGDAYWSLANLKTYRFRDEQIAQMRAQEAAAGLAPVDRYHLCFALGKALEDSGQYEESFRYYERGNALKKDEVRYSADAMEDALRRQAEVFTPQFLASRRGWGCKSADPIFIVGLPRAGSTLLEQILASHSSVEGTMELADIPRLVGRIQGREQAGLQSRYPGALAELGAEQFQRFGVQYLEDTRVYRPGMARGKRFFIDKMPNNFRHIGLIHLMLPNATLIDARREAMACCVSNFKQLFATGQEFTYSLEDIARYYRDYVALMDHWDTVLPGRILRVQHEELVADLEANVRRLLDFCGLDFEPACLEFYKTERSVRTASSEQVRRPIFKEGLDQWRNFEPWLGPLQQALGAEAQPRS
ncbi:MAG: tetratricopeptide repeat-containing sulfotransferase family protein [Steroidobacteraceae bacterium]